MEKVLLTKQGFNFYILENLRTKKDMVKVQKHLIYNSGEYHGDLKTGYGRGKNIS